MQKEPFRNNRVWFFAERTLVYALIAILLFVTLAPLVWVFSTSFKRNEESISFPPKFLPENITFDNYKFVLTNPGLVRSLINDFIVSIGGPILSVAVSALGGYAFARFEFKAKNLIMSVILGSFMIPVVINIIPLCSMLSASGYAQLILGFDSNLPDPDNTIEHTFIEKLL